MAINFTLTKPGDDTFTAITRPIGAEDFTDSDAAVLSDEEALLTYRDLQANGNLPAEETDYPNFQVQVGEATMTLDALLVAAQREATRKGEPLVPEDDSSDSGTQVLFRDRDTWLDLSLGGSSAPEGTFRLSGAYLRRHHLTDSQLYLDYGVGLDIDFPFSDGIPSSSLSPSDREAGITGHTHNNQFGLTGTGRLHLRWYPGANQYFSLGPAASLGWYMMTGSSTGHVRSPADYSTAYCPDEGNGGIFGNDQGTGGCGNRPLGPHTSGNSNDVDSGRFVSTGFLTRGGLRLNFDIPDALSIFLEGGAEAYIPVAGPYGPQGGGYGMAGVTIPLGSSGRETPIRPTDDTPVRLNPIDDQNRIIIGRINAADDGGSDPNVREISITVQRGQPLVILNGAGWPADAQLGVVQDGRGFVPFEDDAYTKSTDEIRMTVPADVPESSVLEIKSGDTVLLRINLTVPAAEEPPAPVVIERQQTITVAGANIVMTPVTTSVRKGGSSPTNIVTLRSDRDATVTITLDNGTPQTVQLRANTPHTHSIPAATINNASTAVGAHNVSVRISGSDTIYNFPFTVQAARPPVATLSSARVTSTHTGSYYQGQRISISVNSSQATRARITVGNHTQVVDLTAGANAITLTGRPGSWNTGAGAGSRQNFTIQIQPLDGGNPVGTRIDVGAVPIKRDGGTTRRRQAPPTVVVPDL